MRTLRAGEGTQGGQAERAHREGTQQHPGSFKDRQEQEDRSPCRLGTCATQLGRATAHQGAQVPQVPAESVCRDTLPSYNPKGTGAPPARQLSGDKLGSENLNPAGRPSSHSRPPAFNCFLCNVSLPEQDRSICTALILKPPAQGWGETRQRQAAHLPGNSGDLRQAKGQADPLWPPRWL